MFSGKNNSTYRIIILVKLITIIAAYNHIVIYTFWYEVTDLRSESLFVYNGISLNSNLTHLLQYRRAVPTCPPFFLQSRIIIIFKKVATTVHFDLISV